MIKSSLLLIAALTTVVTPPAIAQVDPKKDSETGKSDVLQSPEIRTLLDGNPDVQHRFDKWIKAKAQERLDSMSEDPPAAPSLRKELLDRMKRDQKVREHPVASAWEKVDQENQTWLKTVVDEFGWPGKSLVGSDGANAAWLLVQHATHDRLFQKRCLSLMQTAPKGEVAQRDVAYLSDRVREGDKKRQRYGTQLREVDGKLVVNEVEDPAKLNRLREELGMMPIEIYLIFANSNNPLRPKTK
jgi:hypothetical protein